jgi:hypothetical protein
MQKLLLFALGVLLGMTLVRSVEAQPPTFAFASFNGAPKALTADTNGNLNVQLN